MTLLARVLVSLGEAVAEGLASGALLPWLRQRHPELRTEPLPDAAGDMMAARARAQLRETREVAGRLWASGDLRGAAYQEILRALDGEPT